MAEQITGEDWGERLTLSIAEKVRKARIRNGLTVQELADETERLGYPIKRQALVNLESGRKAKIGVDELFIIAAAMRLNPLFLVFDPMRQGEPVEVFPTLEVPQWQALLWASGHVSVLNSIFYTDTRDDGRGEFSMRLRLDDLRGELTVLVNRLESLAESGRDPWDFLEPKEMDDEEVAVRVRTISAEIEAKREQVQTLQDALNYNGVQMNEQWFHPAALNAYWERVTGF